VADSLQRDEFGAMGKVSKFELGAENDDPLVPEFEVLTKGITAVMESEAATVITMGRVAALAGGMPPSCKVQVKACRTLPAVSWAGMQGIEPRTLTFARSSPDGLLTVLRLT